jgi:hypothetical protein
MDIFDIDGSTEDGVQLLKTALPAVVPADATPPEYSRLLAAQDVPRIRAATDVGNAPMAAAFARAGYVTFERQIDMTWR